MHYITALRLRVHWMHYITALRLRVHWMHYITALRLCVHCMHYITALRLRVHCMHYITALRLRVHWMHYITALRLRVHCLQFLSTYSVSRLTLLNGRGQLKCVGTRAENRFRVSAKGTSPFKSWLLCDLAFLVKWHKLGPICVTDWQQTAGSKKLYIQ